MNEATHSPSKTNGSTRPKAKKPARRSFSAAEKKLAVKRVKKGEAESAVAESIPVVDSVLRRWIQEHGVDLKKLAKKAQTRRAGKKVVLVLPPATLHAIKDVAGYLRDVKTDMYALLHSGEIKEFVEYHLNTLRALRRLQSIL